MLLNVYVPNAGKKEKEAISERADLKIRFLHALKEKCDSLREEGKKVRFCDIMILCGILNEEAQSFSIQTQKHRLSGSAFYIFNRIDAIPIIIKGIETKAKLSLGEQKPRWTCLDFGL